MIIPATPRLLGGIGIQTPIRLKIKPKTATGMKIQFSHPSKGIKAIAQPIKLTIPRINPTSFTISPPCQDRNTANIIHPAEARLNLYDFYDQAEILSVQMWRSRMIESMKSLFSDGKLIH